MEPRTLPDTDDLWRVTMEHSPVGMALVSPDGQFLTANASLCDMLGYDHDDLLTRTFQDLTHPDDLDSDMRFVERTLAGEIGSYRVFKRYVRSDGSTLLGDLSVALMRDEDGAPLHFISQIIDLTERQAFLDRLDAAEAVVDDVHRKAIALFESVNVGLLVIDADGTYGPYNRRQREFLDIAFPGGHSGRSGQDGFVYDAEQERVLTSAEMPCARAAAGEEFDDLLVGIGEDPTSRRAISVTARTYDDRTGDLTGAVLAYSDVTDLIRAVNVKDDFVATVSHELRTPLTSALAYLELLETGGTTPDVRRQVTAARRNVLRLSHLVADLLFLTRVSSGSPVIDPHPVDLAAVVREAVEGAAPDAEAAGVALTASLPESLVAEVDAMRMRQAVDDLLDNAITYCSPDGNVVVTLAESDGRIELTVA
ncbi:MAG TPA: PAS domain S-box protein, partial [Nocardioides sp.]